MELFHSFANRQQHIGGTCASPTCPYTRPSNHARSACARTARGSSGAVPPHRGRRAACQRAGSSGPTTHTHEAVRAHRQHTPPLSRRDARRQPTRAARAHVSPQGGPSSAPCRVLAGPPRRTAPIEPSPSPSPRPCRRRTPPCTCARHGSKPMPATCACHDTRAAGGAAVPSKVRTALRITSATRPVHVNRARACVSAACNAPPLAHVVPTPAARTSAPPVLSLTVPPAPPRPIVHQ